MYPGMYLNTGIVGAGWLAGWLVQLSVYSVRLRYYRWFTATAKLAPPAAAAFALLLRFCCYCLSVVL